MTIRSRFFDSEAGDRVYTSDAWKEIFQRIVGEGYVKEVESGLQVTEANPASMNVSVGLGAAWAQGRFFEVYSAVENRAIAASDPTNPRIDRVVVRLSYTNRTITLAVLTGAPAAAPTAPALTRDANTYEMSLAKVSVGAGVTSIVNANITDERDAAAVCGRARPIVGPKASAVTYEGAPNLVGATVEAALDELDAEKAAIADVILKQIVDVKGDMILGSAADTVVRKAAPGNGHLFVANSAQSDGWKASTGTPSTSTYLRGDGAWATVAIPNIQAKKTAGSAGTESVSWSTAFSTTPIVVCTAQNGGTTATYDMVATITSVSTTAASVGSRDISSGDLETAAVKHVTAREAT